MIDVTEKIPTDKMSNAYIQWSNQVVNTSLHVKDNDEIIRDITSCAEFLNVRKHVPLFYTCIHGLLNNALFICHSTNNQGFIFSDT